MTPDERAELLQDATDLAYVHIKFSGLWRELTEDGWEGLSKRHGKKIVELLEEWVDAEFTRLEAINENLSTSRS